MSKKTQAIVIGSGFGGLACAIRLQSAGVQVTLLEKRDKPGGRAYVYKDNGFTFDAGPTVITAPPCLEELFELSTRNIKDYVELVPVTPLYKLFWEDGYVFDYTNDHEKTLSHTRIRGHGHPGLRTGNAPGTRRCRPHGDERGEVGGGARLEHQSRGLWQESENGYPDLRGAVWNDHLPQGHVRAEAEEIR